MSEADSNGLVTNRDAWAYNSSEEALLANMASMIGVFNSEVERYGHEHPLRPKRYGFVSDNARHNSD
jgi:predicted helicase